MQAEVGSGRPIQRYAGADGGLILIRDGAILSVETRVVPKTPTRFVRSPKASRTLDDPCEPKGAFFSPIRRRHGNARSMAA